MDSKLIKIGSVAINPSLVTHVCFCVDGGAQVHFINGGNVTFAAGPDADAAVALLVEPPEDDADAYKHKDE